MGVDRPYLEVETSDLQVVRWALKQMSRSGSTMQMKRILDDMNKEFDTRAEINERYAKRHLNVALLATDIRKEKEGQE